MTNTTSQDRHAIRLQTKYGPWALVTGSSSGIGRALSEEIAASGLNVVLVARRETVLEAFATELRQNYGVEVRVLAADLAQEMAVDELNQATQDLDIGLLVASAGFGTSGRFVDGSLSQEIAMLNVNCRALIEMSWHFSQRFIERGKGGIVLLSSIVSFQGMPNAAHYAATKAYVQNFAEGLRVELADKGVDVLAAAPGPTNSGFATVADMEMGAALRPEDLARPILDALGKQTTVLPGFLSKLLVYGMAVLPRFMRVRIMGNVMHGMTKHQQHTATASA